MNIVACFYLLQRLRYTVFCELCFQTLLRFYYVFIEHALGLNGLMKKTNAIKVVLSTHSVRIQLDVRKLLYSHMHLANSETHFKAPR